MWAGAAQLNDSRAAFDRREYHEMLNLENTYRYKDICMYHCDHGDEGLGHGSTGREGNYHGINHASRDGHSAAEFITCFTVVE